MAAGAGRDFEILAGDVWHDWGLNHRTVYWPTLANTRSYGWLCEADQYYPTRIRQHPFRARGVLTCLACLALSEDA